MTSQGDRISRTLRRTQTGFVEVTSRLPRHCEQGKVLVGLAAGLGTTGSLGTQSVRVRQPELMPVKGMPVSASGRLSTMAGVKVPQNPSRGGRTAVRDEGRLAGYLPNHSCVMKVKRNK